ncbi:hypothetical protein ACVIGB_000889 [Bradyrhizobium sp. USDA 4341]
MKALSSAQRRALIGARDHGNPTWGIHGQSAWGGWNGTKHSLRKGGYLDRENKITDLGRWRLAIDLGEIPKQTPAPAADQVREIPPSSIESSRPRGAEPMIQTYDELVALAEQAKPVPVDTTSEAKDDWGSDRQIDAQNLFFNELEKILPEDRFAELEGYCLKATTEEMLEEALRYARGHMGILEPTPAP